MSVTEQGSAIWKQERAGSVTGSKVECVLRKLKDAKKESAARREYRLQLVAERLTGIPNEMRFKPAGMQRGNDLEADARIAYERQTNTIVDQVGFLNHPTIDWCGVSLDGVVVDEDGNIEIKCPDNSGIHLTNLLKGSAALYKALMGEDLDTNEVPIPSEYYPQVQMGLWVTQRQWCDFISYDPRMPKDLQLHVFRVLRNEPYIKNMEVEVVKFLEEVEDAVSRLLIPGAAQPEALAV